jgi:hypothetical protein
MTIKRQIRIQDNQLGAITIAQARDGKNLGQGNSSDHRAEGTNC